MESKIQRPGVRFTHPCAEEIYTVRKDKMDAYAAEWGRPADRIWREEYLESRADAKNFEFFTIDQMMRIAGFINLT